MSTSTIQSVVPLAAEDPAISSLTKEFFKVPNAPKSPVLLTPSQEHARQVLIDAQARLLLTIQ